MPIIGNENWQFNRNELYNQPDPQAAEGNRQEPMPPAPKTEIVEVAQQIPDGTIDGTKLGPIIDTGNAGITSVGDQNADIRGWAGAEFKDRATAPFRYDKAGNFWATNATISGNITATTGSIGGFDVGSDYIRDAANSFGLASTVTVGDDVRIWAGDTFANRATAPFRIYESGKAFFTNTVTIGGANPVILDGTTGTITGNGAGGAWTLLGNGSTSGMIDSTNGVHSVGMVNASTVTITHGLGKIPMKIDLSGAAYINNGTGQAGIPFGGSYSAHGQSGWSASGGSPAGAKPLSDASNALYTQMGGTGFIQNVTTTTFDIVITSSNASVVCELVFSVEG